MQNPRKNASDRCFIACECVILGRTALFPKCYIGLVVMNLAVAIHECSNLLQSGR